MRPSLNRPAGREIALLLLTLAVVNLAVYQVSWVYAGPVTLLTLFLLVSAMMRRRGAAWRDYGLRFEGRPRLLLGKAVLVFAGTGLTLFLATLLADVFFQRPATHDTRFGDMEGNLPLYLWWVLLGWVFGGFLEELFFRGYLLTRVEEWLGRDRHATVAALFFQAGVFAAVHFYYQGAHGATTLFFGSLFIGTCFVMMGRTVWPLVISHGCLNTLGFLGDFLGDQAI